MHKSIVRTLTALAFVFSSVVTPSQASLFSAPKSEPTLAARWAPPSEFGQVVDASASTSSQKPAVIHIQDLHANYGVQSNIAKLLEHYDRQLGAGNYKVAVEGAQGPVVVTELGKISDRSFKEKVSDRLMQEAELTGAEYFAIVHGRTDLLWGVEDERYHRANITLFKETYKGKRLLARALAGLEKELEPIKAQHYNRAMKKLDRRMEAYQKGKVDISAFNRSLLRRASKMGIQVSRQYPEISQVSGFAPAKAHVDMDRLMTEQSALFVEVGSGLAKNDLQRNIVKASHELDLLKRLTSEEVTTEEVRRLAPRLSEVAGQIQGLLDSTGTAYDKKNFSDTLSASLDFYAVALLRDQFLAQGSLALLNDKIKTVILITGGFHTPGITSQLKKKNISYITLAPTVTDHTEKDKALYVTRLMGKHVDPHSFASAKLVAIPTNALSHLKAVVSSFRFAALGRADNPLASVRADLRNMPPPENVRLDLLEGDDLGRPGSSVIGESARPPYDLEEKTSMHLAYEDVVRLARDGKHQNAVDLAGQLLKELRAIERPVGMTTHVRTANDVLADLGVSYPSLANRLGLTSNQTAWFIGGLRALLHDISRIQGIDRPAIDAANILKNDRPAQQPFLDYVAGDDLGEPGKPSPSEDALRARLREIAGRMAPAMGGVLAADESEATAGKRLDLVGLENTSENRERMRQMILPTEGLKEAGIHAVILYKETLGNKDREGRNLVAHHLVGRGILAGLKTDSGLIDDPDSSGEKLPKPASIQNLPALLDLAKSAGLTFTKWRTTIRAKGPTDSNIRQNALIQAQQARMTQDAGLVPMVEPEVVFDGSDGSDAKHSLADAYASTTKTLEISFEELRNAGVWLDGMVLKTSMILAGKKAEQTPPETVGFETLKGLLKTVPEEVRAIVFLSGGQGDNQATENLDAVIRASQSRFQEARDAAVEELRQEGKIDRAEQVASLQKTPWPISYSFGRGLQVKALEAAGHALDFAKGQAAQLANVREVRAARLGRLQEYRAAREAARKITSIHRAIHAMEELAGGERAGEVEGLAFALMRDLTRAKEIKNTRNIMGFWNDRYPSEVQPDLALEEIDSLLKDVEILRAKAALKTTIRTAKNEIAKIAEQATRAGQIVEAAAAALAAVETPVTSTVVMKTHVVEMTLGHFFTLRNSGIPLGVMPDIVFELASVGVGVSHSGVNGPSATFVLQVPAEMSPESVKELVIRSAQNGIGRADQRNTLPLRSDLDDLAGIVSYRVHSGGGADNIPARSAVFAAAGVTLAAILAGPMAVVSGLFGVFHAAGFVRGLIRSRGGLFTSAAAHTAPEAAPFILQAEEMGHRALRVLIGRSPDHIFTSRTARAIDEVLVNLAAPFLFVLGLPVVLLRAVLPGRVKALQSPNNLVNALRTFGAGINLAIPNSLTQWASSALLGSGLSQREVDAIAARGRLAIIAAA